jgi:hypothetical protein
VADVAGTAGAGAEGAEAVAALSPIPVVGDALKEDRLPERQSRGAEAEAGREEPWQHDIECRDGLGAISAAIVLQDD